MIFRGVLGCALIAISCLAGGCAESEADVPLADGRAAKFSHWEGRWILVNYWAEWCAPCRKEIPDLNRLHGERASSGVVVLGVNYDGLTGEKLATLVEEMKIEFPVLVEDPRLRWAQDPPAVLPTTLLIDPEGKLKEVLVGPHDYATFSSALGLTSSM